MDFEKLNHKLVKMTIKTGDILEGTINLEANIYGFSDVVPFITVERNERLNKTIQNLDINRKFITLTKEQIELFFEFIPVNMIDTCEVIENELREIKLVTLHKKEIQIRDMQIEVTSSDKPGYVSISYKIPKHNQMFEIGNLPIKNSCIEIELSVAFISYAREDKDQVSEITKKLNDYGIITWFDKDNLLPGGDWELAIEEAIEKADYFLLFLSQKTQEKIGYKNRELQLALKQQSYRPRGKIFIIPILLDDCGVPHDISHLHWLKTTDENWFQSLLDTIAPWHVKMKATFLNGSQ